MNTTPVPESAVNEIYDQLKAVRIAEQHWVETGDGEPLAGLLALISHAQMCQLLVAAVGSLRTVGWTK